MSSPIPRTYWVNFVTGEEFRPPAPQLIAPNYARYTPNCAEERIPFPYCYQRIMMDDEEFQAAKAEFSKNVRDRRFQYIFQTRVAKK
jgi:hypothetical protein